MIVGVEAARDPLVPARNHHDEWLIGGDLGIHKVAHRAELGLEAQPLSRPLHRGEFHVALFVVGLAAVDEAATLGGGGMVTHGHRQGLVIALGVTTPAAIAELDGSGIIFRHIDVFLEPGPVVVLVDPGPAAADCELLVHPLLDVPRQARVVTEDQGLALPQEEQLAVLVPVLVGVDRGEELLHIGLEGGRGVAVEEDDPGGVDALTAHFQPGIEKGGMTGNKDLGVGNVQINEVHTCGLQHVGVLAVDPGIGVAVVTEVGLCPVGLASVILDVLNGVLGAHLQVELGVVLHRAARADPAEEVEQTHVAVILGGAGLGVIRHGSVQGVVGGPGGVVNGAEGLGLGNLPGLLHVGEDQVIHVAVQIGEIEGEITRGVELALVGLSHHGTRSVAEGQVAVLGVLDRGQSRVTAGEGQGIQTVVEDDVLHLGGRNGHFQSSFQSAFRLADLQEIRAVQGEPDAAVGRGGGSLGGTDPQLHRTADQPEVEGQIAFLQTILIAEADGGTEDEAVVPLGGESAVLNAGGGATQSQGGI